MDLRQAVLALLLLATALSGCAEETAPEATQGDDTVEDAIAFINGTIPEDFPLPTGQMARDYIESYIMTHPFRLHGDATQSYMDTARDDLVAELEGMGQDVVRQEYDGGVNILAIQNGTVHPDQWIVLSAHYDTVGAGGLGPTVYGAWDDGAGVATLMALAEAFADWEFPYTIVFAFFDGEEKGLIGSREFVAQYDPSEQDEIDIVANINTDPPGLNWPCGDQTGSFPVKIIHQGGRVEDSQFARYGWLHNATEYGLEQAGVPADVRDYSPGIPIATAEGTGVTGSSDHVRFGAVGIANVFLGGTPTTYATGGPSTGGTAALTYPLHTPLDTLEAMEARCTVGSLAGGLETIVQTFVHTLVYMAENAAPEASIIE